MDYVSVSLEIGAILVKFTKMWILPFLILQFAGVEIEAVNYKIVHEDVKLLSYNKDYIEYGNVSLFPFNQTKKAYNITLLFKRQMPTELKVTIDPYKYAANAYRKFPIPKTFAPDICDALARNDYGIHDVYNYSNFRECPFKANVHYYVANFCVDDRRIPKAMLIPGKFKVEGSVFNKQATYGTFEWFVSIVPR